MSAQMRVIGIAGVLMFGVMLMPTRAENTIEPLLGVQVTQTGIEFQVISGGCTEKKDFAIGWLESSPPQLQLIRIRKDDCKMNMPLGTSIQFSWEDLGLQSGVKFTISNPIAVSGKR